MKATIEFFETLRKEIASRPDNRETGPNAHTGNSYDAGDAPTPQELALEDEVNGLKKENLQLRAIIEHLSNREKVSQEEHLSNREKVSQEKPNNPDDHIERLPLTVFIEYAEELPAEQNKNALAIKTMLFDLFNGKISEEERGRLRQLGRKPQPVATINNVNGPLNDIHHNDHVKAGL